MTLRIEVSLDTYYLCDACCDAEIARNPDADVIDGRERLAAQDAAEVRE